MAGEDVKMLVPSTPRHSQRLSCALALQRIVPRHKIRGSPRAYFTSPLTLHCTYQYEGSEQSNSGNHSEAGSQPPKYMSKTSNLPEARAGQQRAAGLTCDERGRSKSEEKKESGSRRANKIQPPISMRSNRSTGSIDLWNPPWRSRRLPFGADQGTLGLLALWHTRGVLPDARRVQQHTVTVQDQDQERTRHSVLYSTVLCCAW